MLWKCTTQVIYSKAYVSLQRASASTGCQSLKSHDVLRSNIRLTATEHNTLEVVSSRQAGSMRSAEARTRCNETPRNEIGEDEEQSQSCPLKRPCKGVLEPCFEGTAISPRVPTCSCIIASTKSLCGTAVTETLSTCILSEAETWHPGVYGVDAFVACHGDFTHAHGYFGRLGAGLHSKMQDWATSPGRAESNA